MIFNSKITTHQVPTMVDVDSKAVSYQTDMGYIINLEEFSKLYNKSAVGTVFACWPTYPTQTNNTLYFIIQAHKGKQGLKHLHFTIITSAYYVVWRVMCVCVDKCGPVIHKF